jgi:hypothetical protein
MPNNVSRRQIVSNTVGVYRGSMAYIPRLMTFFSTHHSPITVKRKARLLTIGTVKLNSR